MNEIKLAEKSMEILKQLEKDGFDEEEIDHIISITKAINDAKALY